MSNPSNRQKEVEIIIPFDGSSPSIEMLGYNGPECSIDSKELINLLDAKDIKNSKKQEYFKVKQKTQIKQKR